MLSWTELSSQEPGLAEACRALLYQYGVGLAFLATVRPDGGPRVHPMCPLIDDRGLFAFLIPSPKRDDLYRDPRYAMHSSEQGIDSDKPTVTKLLYYCARTRSAGLTHDAAKDASRLTS